MNVPFILSSSQLHLNPGPTPPSGSYAIKVPVGRIIAITPGLGSPVLKAAHSQHKRESHNILLFNLS